jgi:6-phosphogluconolactonase (cycloisomerase 2 family)
VGVAVLCLAVWGCPSGESRFIPPGPTAAPGTSSIFVYVAEATNSEFGTNGGAVSAYQLGADGLLPGAPFSTVPAVNPRRLLVHPALDVLYVATLNQILAFDISSGALASLCDDPGTGLAPPCATIARTQSNPFDLAIAQSEEGGFVLYAAEGGDPFNTAATPTRVAAYPLGSAGELPPFPTSIGLGEFSVQFQSVALGEVGLYAGDAGASIVNLFYLGTDGSLPLSAPTPAPINQPTQTPSPTPTPGPTEVATPTPTPTPIAFAVNAPGRIAFVDLPNPVEGGPTQAFYSVEQVRARMASFPIDEFGFLQNRSSESRDVGFYNSILIDPSRTHIHGVAFNVGRVDTYTLLPDGNIDDSSLSFTFEDAAAYPTGIAYLAYTLNGSPQQVVFVSKGGLNRVDAYEVLADGTLASRPFTTTDPRQDSFPSDVTVNVLP